MSIFNLDKIFKPRRVALLGIGRESADLGKQVLANLLMNAVENCQEDCQINIGTGNVTLDQEVCSLHLGAKPGEIAQVVFSDNGKGMDRATRKRIFEPFFTTKAPGQGSGMGLAMVYGIVKQTGGFVFVDSTPGQGAKFSIFLPRHDKERSAAGEQRPRHHRRDRGAFPRERRALVLQQGHLKRGLADARHIFEQLAA